MLKKFLSNIKIKYKLTVAIYLVIIPLLFAVNLYISIRDSRTATNNMISTYKNIVYSVEENIGAMQSDLVDLATYISVNNDIRNILTLGKSDFESNPLLWSKSSPANFLRDMLSVKNYIKTLVIYSNENIPHFYISSDKSVHYNTLKDIENSNTYKAAYRASGDVSWTYDFKDEDSFFLFNASEKVLLSKLIFDYSKKRQIGYLAIGVDKSRYEQICINSLINTNESIILLNGDGQVLVQTQSIPENLNKYLSDQSFSDSLKGDYSYQKKDNYYFFTSSFKNSTKLIYMVPEENWVSGQRLQVFPFVFIIALLIAIFPISMVASIIITKPLKRLHTSMMKFKDGDFNQHVEVTSHDEIGEVSDGYNNMVEDIRNLVEQHYIMTIQERQSELDALQAQINPHFLYNTLDSLYWSALNSGNDELADDIFALSQLFRLVLNRGENEIPLSQEIDLVRAYLQIQKMRFGCKMESFINVPEDIDQYYIPKLIIQPFVENAVVHGIESKSKGGIIEIKISIDDTINVEIRDNGAGIPDNILEEVLKGEDPNLYKAQRVGGYAIRNVKERLNLTYNGYFSLDIQSQSGEGTIVKLRLPKKPSRKRRGNYEFK